MKHIKLFESFYENTYKVYHGSNNKFDTFSYDKIGSGTGSAWNGYGFYFTDNKKEAELYGEYVNEYIITLKKPIDLTKIKDYSISGSGLISFLSSFEVFKNIKYQKYTLKELDDILKKLESEYDTVKIGFSDGTTEWFKHVWIETDNAEYVLYNRDKNEIENKEHIKDMVISKILEKEYGIASLPIRIKDVVSPKTFSNELENLGYDGIIANNSLLSGKEYIVFDTANITKI